MPRSSKTVFNYLIIILLAAISCTGKDPMREQQVLPVELNDSAYLIVRLGDGYFSNIFRKVSSERNAILIQASFIRGDESYKVYQSGERSSPAKVS